MKIICPENVDSDDQKRFNFVKPRIGERVSCLRWMDTDVLVIGSGAAGMQAAAEASRFCDVTLVSKGAWGRDGATISAQADIAVDGRSCREKLNISEGDPADSPEAFALDMLREGEFLGDPKLIRIQTESVAQEVARLRDCGLRLLGLVKNPGHTYARGVWISAVELCSILRRNLSHTSVKLLQYSIACELLKKEGAVIGALFWDRLGGVPFVVRAHATILCTGGAMRLYPYTTAPDSLTGDGLAMAYRAGAHLRDMEFPMFLPYVLFSPKMLEGVTFFHDLAMLTDAHALNRAGERYIKGWDPIRMERTTRDVNASAAGVEILNGRGSPNGGVWLSLAHLPRNVIEGMGDWLPEGLSKWRCGGLDLKGHLPDLSRDALETIPASHFWNGGIEIDENGAASVPGLYAAGEGTGGLHGANRISGNGLGQAIVWGVRAGRAAGGKKPAHSLLPEVDAESLQEALCSLTRAIETKGGPLPAKLTDEIRLSAWRGIGLVRNAEGLGRFSRELANLREAAAIQTARSDSLIWNRDLLASIQNRNLLDVASCVLSAAILRTESRGAHYRGDCPYTEDRWARSVRVARLDNAASAWVDSPGAESGRRKYGQKGGNLP